MRTLLATATVHANHLLTMQVPDDIPPGVHQVVVALQDSPPAEKEMLLVDWPAHDVGLTDPTTTFRREEIYGDDGR